MLSIASEATSLSIMETSKSHSKESISPLEREVCVAIFESEPRAVLSLSNIERYHSNPQSFRLALTGYLLQEVFTSVKSRAYFSSLLFQRAHRGL